MKRVIILLALPFLLVSLCRAQDSMTGERLKIMPGSASLARRSSLDQNIALWVRNGTNSAMTAEELARTFVNAFINRDNDEKPIQMTDKPIFVTAVYESTDKEQSYISVFIDGLKQKFGDRTSFTPEDLWNGVDVVTERYIDIAGENKILEEFKF